MAIQKFVRCTLWLKDVSAEDSLPETCPYNTCLSILKRLVQIRRRRFREEVVLAVYFVLSKTYLCLSLSSLA